MVGVEIVRTARSGCKSPLGPKRTSGGKIDNKDVTYVGNHFVFRLMMDCFFSGLLHIWLG